MIFKKNLILNTLNFKLFISNLYLNLNVLMLDYFKDFIFN